MGIAIIVVGGQHLEGKLDHPLLVAVVAEKVQTKISVAQKKDDRGDENDLPRGRGHHISLLTQVSCHEMKLPRPNKTS